MQISPEIEEAARDSAAGIDEVLLSDALQQNPDAVLQIIQYLLYAAKINAKIEIKQGETGSKALAAIQESDISMNPNTDPDSDEIKASPEEKSEILGKLEKRFMERTKGRKRTHDWPKIENTLSEVSDTDMLSLIKMEQEGHCPTIFKCDKHGFSIATGTKETPENTRNCTYTGQESIGLCCIAGDCAPSAVEMAREMGVTLMTAKQYRAFIKTGEYDIEGYTLLQSSGDDILCIGNRNRVYFTNKGPNADRGWRGIKEFHWAE